MTNVSPNWMRRLLPLAWAAVAAAPFVSHFAIATGQFRDVAAVLALAEVTTLCGLVLRRTAGWGRLLGGAAALCLLALVAARLLWPAALGAVGLMAASGVSHAIIYGSLLALFGRSLRPGRTALVTGLVTRLRGPLGPELVRYTRIVTIAWCWFFAAQLAVSALLLAVAPGQAWSLFVNVLDGPSVALMFLVEYSVRRLRFTNHRHISPMETFRSFARGRAGEG